MGMTIDEALERLCVIQEVYNDDIANAMFIGFNDKDNESIEVAIDTMRKYQQITEIVKSKTTRVSYDIGFRQIKKVVEDGKID